MNNRLAPGIALVAVCAASAVAQQGSLFGTHYRPVIVNTRASGAGVTADVTQFPLLIRLDSANAEGMFAQVAAGGGDLRVADATGTVAVPFEVEYWNAAEKRAAIWVLAGTVKGNDSVAAFRLYWGREGAGPISNPQAVFDTANGFQAVFHLSEGTHDTGYDATANGFRAAPYNAPSDTVGNIGRARRFNGIDQYFQVPNSAAGRLNLQMTDSYTFSTWVRPAGFGTTANSGNKILGKGDNQYSLEAYDNAASPKYWGINTRGNNAFLYCRSDGSPVITANEAIGAWHHLAGTFQGAAVGGAISESLFVDGALVNTLAATNMNNTGRVLTYNVSIGVQTAGTAPVGTQFTRYWNGQLDELRVENRARSAAWIKLSFATQRPGGTAVKLGSTEPPVALAGSRNRPPSPSLSVLPSGDGLLFRIGETGAAREARITLRDARGQTVWKTSLDLGNTREAFWKDARSASGILTLRVRLVDADGTIVRMLDRKLPFTR